MSRKARKNSTSSTPTLSEIEIRFANAAEAVGMAKQAISSLERTLALVGTPKMLFNSVTVATFSGGTETLWKQLNGLWDTLAKKGLVRSRKEAIKYMIPQTSKEIMRKSRKNYLERAREETLDEAIVAVQDSDKEFGQDIKDHHERFHPDCPRCVEIVQKTSIIELLSSLKVLPPSDSNH